MVFFRISQLNPPTLAKHPISARLTQDVSVVKDLLPALLCKPISTSATRCLSGQAWRGLGWVNRIGEGYLYAMHFICICIHILSVFVFVFEDLSALLLYFYHSTRLSGPGALAGISWAKLRSGGRQPGAYLLPESGSQK